MKKIIDVSDYRFLQERIAVVNLDLKVCYKLAEEGGITWVEMEKNQTVFKFKGVEYTLIKAHIAVAEMLCLALDMVNGDFWNLLPDVGSEIIFEEKTFAKKHLTVKLRTNGARNYIIDGYPIPHEVEAYKHIDACNILREEAQEIYKLIDKEVPIV